MKLSDIKGKRVMKAIAGMAKPFSRIVSDPAVLEMFKGVPEGESRQWVIQHVGDILPELIDSHGDDVIQILAAVEGVRPATYEKNLTMPKLFQDVVDLLTSDGLPDFLA